MDLSLIGKQLHWNIVGPLFRPLHLYLDELVDEWRLLADAVAERATALGFFPDRQCGTVAQKTEFKPLPEGASSGRQRMRPPVRLVVPAGVRDLGQAASVSAHGVDVLAPV